MTCSLLPQHPIIVSPLAAHFGQQPVAAWSQRGVEYEKQGEFSALRHKKESFNEITHSHSAARRCGRLHGKNRELCAASTPPVNGSLNPVRGVLSLAYIHSLGFIWCLSQVWAAARTELCATLIDLRVLTCHRTSSRHTLTQFTVTFCYDFLSGSRIGQRRWNRLEPRSRAPRTPLTLHEQHYKT